MISARRALVGHLRTFFETQVAGLYGWNDVVMHPAEDADLDARGRRNPLGKHKEVVTVRFGEYELMLESPEHHPPLGRASLEHDGRVECDGPLDMATWVMIGNLIKGKHNGSE